MDMPMARLCMISSVKAHRRPPTADAEKTMMRPGMETAVTLKTIRKTPIEMRPMTRTKRSEYFSSLNRKAKKRTKMSDDDLHIAALVRHNLSET